MWIGKWSNKQRLNIWSLSKQPKHLNIQNANIAWRCFLSLVSLTCRNYPGALTHNNERGLRCLTPPEEKRGKPVTAAWSCFDPSQDQLHPQAENMPRVKPEGSVNRQGCVCTQRRSTGGVTYVLRTTAHLAFPLIFIYSNNKKKKKKKNFYKQLFQWNKTN